MAAAPEQLELDAARTQTEALYRQHGAAVLRICRAVLHDRAEAEDAAQQVFLSAHRALLGGAVPQEPLAWLATIARRECWTRSSAAAATLRGEAEPTGPDPAVTAIRNTEVTAMWTAVAELPPAQREAWLLREIRGLSYVQLGAELSLSAPATRSLLSRARRRIRLRLRDLHAALGGASWIEALARLCAGGTSPAAPAARAAALGFGAAAIAGGAFVTPSVLQHHVRRQVTAPVAKAAPTPAHAARHSVHRVRHAAPVRPAVVRTAPVAATVSRREAPNRGRSPHVEQRAPSPSRADLHESGGQLATSHVDAVSSEEIAVVTPTSGRDGSPDGGARPGSDTSGRGGTTAVEPTTTTPVTTPELTVALETSGHEGSGSGGGSGSDGSSSSSDGSSGHGGSGGGSSDGGGSDGGH